MMKPYQYQIIRYVHDQGTGEFVNVGVVVYAPQDKFLRSIVTTKYARVSNFFPTASGLTLVQTLRQFRREIDRISQQFQELFAMPSSIDQITSSILPPDDSALQLTPIARAIDVDLTIALEDQYNRLVEKYIEADESTTQTDEEAWRQVYKTYFDQYGITSRLIEHEVRTQNDSFLFEKAWKNEVWHCYQPLSLNLTDENSVKTKVYRWSGILAELATATEIIHLTFLLTRSEEKIRGIDEFVHNRLEVKAGNLHVQIATEEQAEAVAREVKQAIKDHDARIRAISSDN